MNLNFGDNSNDDYDPGLFEYVWEYHFIGDDTEDTNCTPIYIGGDDCQAAALQSVQKSENLLSGPTPIGPDGPPLDGCAGFPEYDPTCYDCQCNTTTTENWFNLGESVFDTNSEINFTAWQKGSYDNIEFRVRLRHIASEKMSAPQTNSSHPNIFINDGPPTLDDFPEYDAIGNPRAGDNINVTFDKDNFSFTVNPGDKANITSGSELTDVFDHIDIIHNECKGGSTARIVIKDVNNRGGDYDNLSKYYYNIRKIDDDPSTLTYNINGSNLVEPDPIDSPKGFPVPATMTVTFPDDIPENRDEVDDNDVGGLPAGIYALRIENLQNANDGATDDDGHQVRMCYSTYIVVIREPASLPEIEGGLVVSSYNDFEISCPNAEDGTISASASGGIGSTYTFTLYNSDGPVNSSNDTGTFPNLLADTYSVGVEDNYGCESESNPETTLEPPPALVLSLGDPIDATCYGSSNGEIPFSVAGGTGSYEIKLFDNGYDGSEDYDHLNVVNATEAGNYSFPDLESGTYKVRVFDSNNCLSAIATQFIDQPSQMNIAEVTVNHPICLNGTDGSFEVSGSGGNPYNDSNEYRFALALDSDGALTGLIKTGITVEFDELAADTYTVYMEGADACIVFTEVIVPENPNPISIAEVADSQQPPSCPGIEDGSISVVVSNYQGTTPSLDFRLFDDTGANIDFKNNETSAIATFDGLLAGFYRVEVTDENAGQRCTTDVTIELLNRSDFLKLEVDSKTQPSCHGFDDGSITFRASGGDAPYQFSIDGTNFFVDDGDDHLFTFENLSKNTDGGYTVYVADANFSGDPSYCTASSSTTLDEPTLINISEEITHVTCFGENTGSITASASGGTPANGYAFEWIREGETTILSTTNKLTDVPAGNYRVKVTNGTCPFKVETFTIKQPLQVGFKALGTGTTSCAGRNDGFVTIEAMGGTPPYTYYVDGQPQSTGLFTDLAPGNTHTAIITDKYGCQADTVFTIGIGEVLLSIEQVTNETCFESNDGELLLSAEGGTAPYQFSIDNGNNFSNLNEFQNLPAGNYDVIARDNTGCLSEVAVATITQPDALSVIATLEKDAACGLNIGAASVSVSGGTLPYDVTWMDADLQTVNPDSLYAGTYTAEVTDANGCYAQDVVTINELPPHSLSHSVINEPYCGLPLGTARVDVTGGVGPFTYLWSDQNATTSAEASNLSAGSYTVLVTDTYRGCTQEITFILNDGEPISATQSVVKATCNQSNGEATLSISGGVPPYNYDWGAASNSSTASATELAAGIYPVVISDNVGCELIFNVTVSNEDGPQLDNVIITSSYCGLATGEAEVVVSGGNPPYSYSWVGNSSTDSKATELAAGSYTAQITDITGCALTVPVTIADDESVEPTLSILNTTNSACGLEIGSAEVQMIGGLAPYSYAWDLENVNTSPIATDLAAGSYQVTGTDAKGCSQSITVTISDNPDPVLSFVAKTTSACGLALGSATVSMSGGVTPYSYAWNDASGQVSATATALTAGTYDVYGIDGNGCTSNTLRITILEESAMELTTSDVIPVSCVTSQDGEAEVAVSNGLAPFSYLWDDPSNQTTQRATGLSSGEYVIKVTDDNGCEAELTVTVPAPDPVAIANLSEDQPNCYEGCDGSLEVLAEGGSGQYTYVWSNGQNGARATGLCVGDYSVTITDSNGCQTIEEISLGQPEEITTTGIPKHAVLCEGQDFILDPGAEWIDYLWESTNGFSSNERVITVSDPGSYFLTVHSDLNCEVRDTFLLENDPNLLQAEFLMSSEAYVGDTVVVVDISWPLPETISWDLPAEANVLTAGDFYNDLSFNRPGEYTVTLNAYLGECQDVFQKSITILSNQAAASGRQDAGNEVIRQFILYPNPNNGLFTVKVILQEVAPIELSVVSLQNGLIVGGYKDLNAESYEAEFDLPNLVSGTYILNLKALGKEQNIRFMVK